MKRHGPAVLAAAQGHIRRLDQGSDPLCDYDWTRSGVERRSRERLMGRADRILLWVLVCLALLAVVGAR